MRFRIAVLVLLAGALAPATAGAADAPPLPSSGGLAELGGPSA